MTRGMYFTEREKRYIIENVENRSYADIAERLSVLYSKDNNGYRSKGGVQAFVQRKRRAGRLR